MSISVEFQQRLQDLIEEKELNRTKIAQQIGVDYRSFSNALNYGILPKPQVLVKMADYFNISISYLLGNTDNDIFIMSKSPSDFHARLESLRKDNNISYYKIAKDCHFDKSCISKWRSLKHIPNLEILELLADYFDVSLDYLLGRTDER